VVDLSSPVTSDRVTVVPFQRADVAVGPNGSRIYRLIVPDPPPGQVCTEGTLRLVGAGSSAGARIPVEVSRFYAVTDGRYGPGGPAFAGMHLPRDLHIQVRRFSVEVVETLRLRRTSDPTAAELTSLPRGAERFLLVPAPIVRTANSDLDGWFAPRLRVTQPLHPGRHRGGSYHVPGHVRAAFRVRFPADSPPGEVVMTVVVGIAGIVADLTTTLTLTLKGRPPARRSWP